jgi:hypothetical protein
VPVASLSVANLYSRHFAEVKPASMYISCVQTAMESSCPKRKDLVKPFPLSYSFSALHVYTYTRFDSAYKQVTGFDAPKQVISTLVRTFQGCGNK